MPQTGRPGLFFTLIDGAIRTFCESVISGGEGVGGWGAEPLDCPLVTRLPRGRAGAPVSWAEGMGRAGAPVSWAEGMGQSCGNGFAAEEVSQTGAWSFPFAEEVGRAGWSHVLS